VQEKAERLRSLINGTSQTEKKGDQKCSGFINREKKTKNRDENETTRTFRSRIAHAKSLILISRSRLLLGIDLAKTCLTVLF
jgi:hypothetical protein